MDGKNIIWYINPKKLLFGLIMIFIIIICGILSAQNLYEVIISVFSIITVIYLSEGKTMGCICGLIFSCLYAPVCFSRQLYGLMLFQIFFGIPLYLLSIFTWKKNQSKDAVVVKRLPLNKLILVIIASFAGYWCIFYLLKTIGSSNIPIDSLTLVLAVSGVITLSLRYIEQWYFNIAANFCVAVLWINKAIESISNLNFFISAVIFVIINIIGLISWLEIQHQQANENYKNF